MTHIPSSVDLCVVDLAKNRALRPITWAEIFMRLGQKHDIVLLFGIALALVVMFQEPLQGLLAAGQAIQDRYGLALFVPGLAVLCIVFLGHHALARVRRASEKKQAIQIERFIRLG